MAAVTHTVANIQCGKAIAVVIIHQNRLNTVLFSVHKRGLFLYGWSSFKNLRLPFIGAADDPTRRRDNMVMKSQPGRMCDSIARTELPDVLVSSSVDSKHFCEVFIGPGRKPSKAILAVRVAGAVRIFQYVSLLNRPDCMSGPPPECDPVSTVFAQRQLMRYLKVKGLLRSKSGAQVAGTSFTTFKEDLFIRRVVTTTLYHVTAML